MLTGSIKKYIVNNMPCHKKKVSHALNKERYILDRTERIGLAFIAVMFLWAMLQPTGYAAIANLSVTTLRWNDNISTSVWLEAGGNTSATISKSAGTWVNDTTEYKIGASSLNSSGGDTASVPLMNADQSYTLTWWAKLGGTAHTWYFMFTDDSGTAVYRMATLHTAVPPVPANRFVIFTGDWKTTPYGSSTITAANTSWIHYGVTYNHTNNNLTLWVNGNRDYTGTNLTNPSMPSPDYFTYTTDVSTKRMDDIRFYRNQVATPTQMLYIMNNSVPSAPSAPAAPRYRIQLERPNATGNEVPQSGKYKFKVIGNKSSYKVNLSINGTVVRENLNATNNTYMTGYLPLLRPNVTSTFNVTSEHSKNSTNFKPRYRVYRYRVWYGATLLTDYHITVIGNTTGTHTPLSTGAGGSYVLANVTVANNTYEDLTAVFTKVGYASASRVDLGSSSTSVGGLLNITTPNVAWNILRIYRPNASSYPIPQSGTYKFRIQGNKSSYKVNLSINGTVVRENLNATNNTYMTGYLPLLRPNVTSTFNISTEHFKNGTNFKPRYKVVWFRLWNSSGTMLSGFNLTVFGNSLTTAGAIISANNTQPNATTSNVTATFKKAGYYDYGTTIPATTSATSRLVNGTVLKLPPGINTTLYVISPKNALYYTNDLVNGSYSGVMFNVTSDQAGVFNTSFWINGTKIINSYEHPANTTITQPLIGHEYPYEVTYWGSNLISNKAYQLDIRTSAADGSLAKNITKTITLKPFSMNVSYTNYSVFNSTNISTRLRVKVVYRIGLNINDFGESALVVALNNGTANNITLSTLTKNYASSGEFNTSITKIVYITTKNGAYRKLYPFIYTLGAGGFSNYNYLNNSKRFGVTIDRARPYINANISATYGFYSTRPSGKIKIYVYDAETRPQLCNITTPDGVNNKVNSVFRNNNKSYKTNFTAGNNTWLVKCWDLANNSKYTNVSLDTLYVTKFYLIDEREGTNANLTQFKTARLRRNDTNVSYNFLTNATVSRWAVFNNSVTLRFEREYDAITGFLYSELDGDLITENETRLCAAKPQSIYEMTLYSSARRKVVLKSTYANCYSVASYTQYAYGDAMAAKAYVISTLYYLYTWDIDGNKVLLATLDGSEAATISLDQIEFSKKSYDMALSTDQVSISKTDNSTLYIYYDNPQKDNRYIDIIIYNGSNILFNYTEYDTPNNFSLYWDMSTVSIPESMLKLVIIKHELDGSLVTITKLFDKNGNMGMIDGNIIIIIVILLLIFGFTFVAFTHVFNFFGIIICLIALALTTWTVQTDLIRFLQAIIIIMGIFIFLVFKEENIGVT